MDPNSPNPNYSNPHHNLPFLELLQLPTQNQGFYSSIMPTNNAFQSNPYPTQNQFSPQAPFVPTSLANLNPQQLQELYQMRKNLIQLQTAQNNLQNQPSPSPSQQPQSTPSPQEHRLVDEDDDVVVETQPEVLRRDKRRGKKKATNEPLRRVKWTSDEEVMLAESFISISCDPRVGNAQPGDAFWERISKRFHDGMGCGIYRTSDALSGKWTSLLRECNAFNGIYNNTKSMHVSGHSSENVTEVALTTYKNKNNGKDFGHIQAWKVLHLNKKWEWQPDALSQSSGSKRSEPEVVSVNLNDEPIDVDEPQQICQKRPIRRTKAKRIARESPSSSAADTNMALLVAEKLGGRLKEHVEFLKEK